MITCADITSYLDTNYNYKDSLSVLSNNKKISCTTIAYDFDKIKYCIYRDNCASADALLIKRNLNLIEFKTGFSSPEDNADDKLRKENLVLKIRAKAYESLHLLETAIIDEISENDTLDKNIKITFCAVIDTDIPVVAEEAITDILSVEGGVRENKDFKTRIIENALGMYRKET